MYGASNNMRTVGSSKGVDTMKTEKVCGLRGIAHFLHSAMPVERFLLPASYNCAFGKNGVVKLRSVNIVLYGMQNFTTYHFVNSHDIFGMT